MNRLPQEVHDQIVYSLSSSSYRRDRLLLAATSRKFQLAVERLTFRSISICGLEDLDYLAQVATPQRIPYISALCLRMETPPGHVAETDASASAALSDFETNAARDRANKVAIESIAKLFHILASWYQGPDVGPSLALEIDNAIEVLDNIFGGPLTVNTQTVPKFIHQYEMS